MGRLLPGRVLQQQLSPRLRGTLALQRWPLLLDRVPFLARAEGLTVAYALTNKPNPNPNPNPTRTTTLPES